MLGSTSVPGPGVLEAWCLCDFLGEHLGRAWLRVAVARAISCPLLLLGLKSYSLLSPCLPRPAVGCSLPSPARPAPAPAPTPVRIQILSRLRTTVKVGGDKGQELEAFCGALPREHPTRLEAARVPGGLENRGHEQFPGVRGFHEGAHSTPEVQQSPSLTAVATPYSGQVGRWARAQAWAALTLGISSAYDHLPTLGPQRSPSRVVGAQGVY